MKSSMSEDLNNPVSVGDSGPVLSLVESMLINMTATQYISLVNINLNSRDAGESQYSKIPLRLSPPLKLY